MKKRALATLLCLVALFAFTFNSVESAKYPDYRFYAPPTREAITCVTVKFVKNEEEMIARYGANGVFKGNPETSCGVIIVPAPQNFNDGRALMILGHEVMHALGAYHD